MRQQAVDRVAADTQVRLDPFGDLLPAGQHWHDRQPGGHAQLIQRIEIEGVAGGDDQRAVVAMHREKRFAMDEPRREVLEQLQIDFLIDQIDECQPDLVGQRPQGGLFGHVPQLHGRLVQPHALGLGTAGLFQLLGIQQSAAEEQFTDVHCTCP